VLGNRIFIADELERVGAYDKWVQLISAFEKNKNDQAFAKGFLEIMKQIRTAALKSMEVS
jgi:hypothetical protein